MDIEKQAEKEIKRMDGIIGKVELVDDRGKTLFQAAKTYFSDSKYFL